MLTITQRAQAALEDKDLFLSEEAFRYLSEPWHFQNFTKYTLHLAEKKGLDLTPEQLPAYLKEEVLALGPVSKYLNSEISKFLNQSFQFRPEIGDYRADMETPRELALRLCFVFRLSFDEAKDFLRKGCGSYPFHARSAYESACYYCVLKSWPYETVLELLRRYEAAPAAEYPDCEDAGTRKLTDTLQQSNWESDEAFLQTFLIPNKAMFINFSKTTIQTYYELRFNLCQQIINLRKEYYLDGLHYGELAKDPIFRRLKEEIQRLVKHDPAFSGCANSLSNWEELYRDLQAVDCGLRKKYRKNPGEAEARYEALINNAVSSHQLVKEILFYNPDTSFDDTVLANTTLVNCFPRRQYLTDFQKRPEDGTRSTKIRKAIILLFFMSKYYGSSCNRGRIETRSPVTPQVEQFQKELNDLLNVCGLSQLYAADPFDWLILKSARALLYPELAEDDPNGYFNKVIGLSLPQQS